MLGQISLFENKKEKSTDWKWSFKDYPEKNGLKVFSCFACGGGSTMGYKLCGCEVLGCNEIDPRMNEVYVKNHNPKYNYLEDIRDFNKRDDLPEELFDLDILDGSPPCSTFSMAGQREDAWGVKKKFREGQKDTKFYNIALQATDKDKSIADTRKRLGQKGSAFQTFYIRDNMVMPTLRSKPDLIDLNHIAYVSKETIRNSQTFPQDYKFEPNTYSNICYICGMSVPPIMIKRLVTRLIEGGLFDYKLGDKNGN